MRRLIVPGFMFLGAATLQALMLLFAVRLGQFPETDADGYIYIGISFGTIMALGYCCLALAVRRQAEAAKSYAGIISTGFIVAITSTGLSLSITSVLPNLITSFGMFGGCLIAIMIAALSSAGLISWLDLSYRGKLTSQVQQRSTLKDVGKPLLFGAVLIALTTTLVPAAQGFKLRREMAKLHLSHQAHVLVHQAKRDTESLEIAFRPDAGLGEQDLLVRLAKFKTDTDEIATLTTKALTTKKAPSADALETISRIETLRIEFYTVARELADKKIAIDSQALDRLSAKAVALTAELNNLEDMVALQTEREMHGQVDTQNDRQALGPTVMLSLSFAMFLPLLRLVASQNSDLRQLARTVQATRNSIVRMNPDKRIAWVNEAFSDLTGYASEEALGQYLTLLQNGETETDTMQELEEAMESKKTIKTTLQATKKSGEAYWIDIILHTLWAQDGAVEGYILEMADVTEMTASRAKLTRALTETRNQQVLLETVSDMANIGAVEFDFLERKLTISDKARQLHGIEPDVEPTLELTMNVYIEPYKSEFEKIVLEVGAQGGSWDFTAPVRLPNGEAKWLRSIGSAVQFEGRTIRLLGATMDVTSEQRSAEKVKLEARISKDVVELQTAFLEDRFSDAFELALSSLLSITDSEYGFVSEVLIDENDSPYLRSRALTNIGWNDETRAMYENAAGKGLEFRNLNTLFGVTLKTQQPIFANDAASDPRQGGLPEGHPAMNSFLGAPIFVGTEMIGMIGLANREQPYTPQLLDDLRPILDAIGQFLVSTRERDARLLAEVALAAALQKAEQASNAKSMFLANMSHEIRTPLNGVIGITGALARSELSTSQREMVELVQTSGEALERLLSDILDISKMEAGKLDVHYEPFDLQQTIETAAELMRVRADDKGIKFKIHYDDAAKGKFVSDALRIRQIVSNLASNAIKFTNEGGVSIHVGVEGQDKSTALLTIRVKDSGIGFDESAAQQLFARFEQADGSITRNFGGTGLGLSICKSLVDLLGGTIKASSIPGAGSTFTVELPIQPTPDNVSALPTQSSVWVADADLSFEGDGESAPLNILLAEDHPVNQKVVGLMLAPYGVTLTIANNGQEALDAYRVNHFDLILMDMQMPVMDGLTAVGEIRKHEAQSGQVRTPIAMISANAMREHVELSMQAGCDTHIAKPISSESLIQGIEEAIARAGNFNASLSRTPLARETG